LQDCFFRQRQRSASAKLNACEPHPPYATKNQLRLVGKLHALLWQKVLLLGIENEETRKRPERATWHTADMSKSDPPTSADSKLRTKTGARFKRTPHQKQSLESVPPPQKNHEGLRELDLECDQKSPVSPVSSSIKGDSLTNSAEK
jgi:hypothetical protein